MTICCYITLGGKHETRSVGKEEEEGTVKGEMKVQRGTETREERKDGGNHERGRETQEEGMSGAGCGTADTRKR